MFDAEPNSSILRAIYRRLLPTKLRLLVYSLRHQEYRFGEKLSRVARDGIERFMDSVADQALLKGNVVEVGAGERVANKMRFAAGARKYSRTDIVNCSGAEVDILCDCTRMPFPDGSLDAVICSEVLEHVPNCLAAMREFSRVIKPGGHLVCTMPFFFPLHGADFWRITPTNLKLLFGESFELVREETVHLFSPDDPFVIAVQQLWKRKNADVNASISLSGFAHGQGGET
jgi:SAM-dependent methyltransferase